ncbi:MAG TPA: metallophosphoesterase [Acidobacteriota bacterium]|nr:metallophosphoesterase [Acidobacteriota bacterium]HNB72748.1 metallophosphoesterase [Acidobacteriota bacterium]HND18815.1 metallophosphoesterase [Acidobacteriota bacterium]
MEKPFYFGAVGDVHGEMHRMVALLSGVEKKRGIQLEFVLQVGDFEPHRDEQDLQTMAAPSKYRDLGDFHHYHQGWRSFPWPIYFIGGNHEPYGYLDQFPEGDWLTENCRYLGRSGWLELDGGFTMAGLSAIYNSDWFSQPRPDVSLFGTISNKSFIYFNESDLQLLLDLERNIDVLLLHEWPANIIDPNDQAEFEQARRSMRYDCVGNEMSEIVMHWLSPKLVLCGHMHKKYRRQLQSSKNQALTICCLANVHQGPDSVAIFEVNQDGEITELQ